METLLGVLVAILILAVVILAVLMRDLRTFADETIKRVQELERASRDHASRLDAGASLWKDLHLRRIPDLERRVSTLDDPTPPHLEP